MHPPHVTYPLKGYLGRSHPLVTVDDPIVNTNTSSLKHLEQGTREETFTEAETSVCTERVISYPQKNPMGELKTPEATDFSRGKALK